MSSVYSRIKNAWPCCSHTFGEHCLTGGYKDNKDTWEDSGNALQPLSSTCFILHLSSHHHPWVLFFFFKFNWCIILLFKCKHFISFSLLPILEITYFWPNLFFSPQSSCYTLQLQYTRWNVPKSDLGCLNIECVQANDWHCALQDNPAVMLENLRALKAKHTALCSQVRDIAAAQKESMDSIRNNLSGVMELIQHFQQTTDVKVPSQTVHSLFKHRLYSDCIQRRALWEVFRSLQLLWMSDSCW